MRVASIVLAGMLAFCAVVASAETKEEKMAKIKKDIALFEGQLQSQKAELRGWQNLNTASGWAAIGKSPGPFTHITPGQDPTNVGTWRDPVSQGNAFETAIEANEHINRLEPEIEYTEDAIEDLKNKLAELEKEPAPTPEASSGSPFSRGGDGGGGGGGGGGGY